jgi:hypothetical protein
VLGDALAAVVLHGSLALGGYVPGRSDIDLLVLVDEPLADAQLAALAGAARTEPPKAPARVDLRVVTRRVAAVRMPAAPMDAFIDLAGFRDLVVELSLCRTHGRSLRGPAPPELIGEVPDEWVDAVADAQLADW